MVHTNNRVETKAESTPKTKSEKTKLIVAAGIGNFLEIFDFTVYSFFAGIIGQVFFKSEDWLTSLLFSVGVFGVGFVMRPLGSIMIGAYADRKGRKAAMLLTILLMALGSALIGFAPPASAIGIMAPILLVVGRLLQGFSAGGEIGAATTLLMESAERHQRGFFVSWQFIGQGLSSLTGSLMAASLTAVLSTEALHSWGWRVPFIFSLLIIPVGLYIRAHINETFEAESHTQQSSHPFAVLLNKHLLQTCLGVLYILPVTALMYILIFYMPNYLKTVTTMGESQTFLVTSYASIVMIIFSIISGFLCDRLERRKPVALGILLIALIASFFDFYFVATPTLFFIFHTIGISCLGLLMTFSVLMIMEAFERSIRATATGVIYAFGVTIFGGTAQIIVTWLLKISDKNIMAPFWYLGTALVIGIIAASLFHEKRHER